LFLLAGTGSNRPQPGTRGSEMTATKQPFAVWGKLTATEPRRREHSSYDWKYSVNRLPQDVMSPKYIAIAGRWVFGLWYLMTGGAWLVTHALGRGAAHQETASGAIAFQKALTESHFMDPLLAIACLFGGGALLIRRTAPLGIAMLAPVVVVIFLFHLVLTGNWIWGTLNLVWFMGLVWRYRGAFTALWTSSETL
jgi:hypothetical protein